MRFRTISCLGFLLALVGEISGQSGGLQDDSKRIIPVTLATDGEKIEDNHPVQICDTPPPELQYRDKLQILQSARKLEKRGYSRLESGLHDLGLESYFDLIERDHPDWETGENITDVSTNNTHRRLQKRQNAFPQIVVETYMHIVTTRDQSQYYTQKTRDAIINNQACNPRIFGHGF